MLGGAYLSNVFWNQLIWRGLNMQFHAIYHPFLTLFGTWILTWILYLLHPHIFFTVGGQKLKSILQLLD